MKRNTFLLAIAGFAALLAPSAFAGTVEFSPISQSVALGNQASIDILAVGLGNGVSPALAGFDLTVFFDSTILAPNSVAFSSRLGDPNDPLETINFNQYVFSGPTIIGIEMVNVSLLNGATLFALQTAGPAGFSLGTIVFDTIKGGTSPLTFLVASSSDETATDLGLTGGTGSIDVQGASGVPEPGTWMTGGAGLLLACLVRRLRK